jgi:hypothetical protein
LSQKNYSFLFLSLLYLFFQNLGRKILRRGPAAGNLKDKIVVYSSSGRTVALGFDSASNRSDKNKGKFHPIEGHEGPEGE